MTEKDLSHIHASLPENFPFYGMGEVSRLPREQVEQARPLSAILEGKAGVSFRLLGDPAALLVVLFDERLDSYGASMYTEMGNILASRLCQRLSEQGEGDLMITPPLELKPEQLARLLRANFPYLHQSYEHVNQGRRTLVETLILPVIVNAGGAEGQAGNA